MSRLIIRPADRVWTRYEVHGADGTMHRPAAGHVIVDETSGPQPEAGPRYHGHFTAHGDVVLDVPDGEYTVVAERGMEHRRVSSRVEVRGDTALDVTVPRWADLASAGWRSADLHLHRPVEHAAALLDAAGLDLGAFITTWNGDSLWAGRTEYPGPTTYDTGGGRYATVANAEDERAGGAWMLHNLRRPVDLSGLGGWYPSGRDIVGRGRRLGAWFDCEKPTWWEAPVLVALLGADSMGVVTNHFLQYGTMAHEAWGRPRDTERYPGPLGFALYQLDLYYRYLNCGHRIPVSAGSASGALPSSPGQNRVYVRAEGRFDPDAFFRALAAGRSFATNGPALFLDVDGAGPGATVQASQRTPLRVTATASAAAPIARIELVANGRVVADAASDRLEAELVPGRHTWLAARCFTRTETDAVVRFAHTSPVYLWPVGEPWDASGDAAYFAAWIDDLVALVGQHDRLDDRQRGELLGDYRRARRRYDALRT